MLEKLRVFFIAGEEYMILRPEDIGTAIDGDIPESYTINTPIVIPGMN